jgi:demethylmenaquinone methyltransferase/2-methoxy-6-polyprenyl-1,4-benzoquinol methylase
MFDTIAPRYDLVNRIMSLGLDQVWRARTVDALALAPGSVVVDLACGTGDLGVIARRRGYVTLGADSSAGMLAARRGEQPVVRCDAAELPFADGAVDGVLCGYALRNFTDLPVVFAEVARVLRPGGRLAALEVARPRSRVLAGGHRVWFEGVVPLLGAALSDADAYRYLPRSTAYLPDEPALRAILAASGFSTVGRRLLHGGLSQVLVATRRGLPAAAPPTAGTARVE